MELDQHGMDEKLPGQLVLLTSSKEPHFSHWTRVFMDFYSGLDPVARGKVNAAR